MKITSRVDMKATPTHKNFKTTACPLDFNVTAQQLSQSLRVKAKRQSVIFPSVIRLLAQEG